MNWFVRSRFRLVLAHIIAFAIAFAIAVLLVFYVPPTIVAGMVMGAFASSVLAPLRARRREWLRERERERDDGFSFSIKYYGSGIIKRDVQ